MLEIKELSHHYGQQQVLDHVFFTVQPGQLACLVGASGCGKSTLLRLVAGLDKVQQGAVLYHGEIVADTQTHVPPQLRRIGLVFQHPSLFPHLTVEENIQFGLQRWSSERGRQKVQEMMALIGLEAHGQKYPHQLSGGQHQRVALARTLAPEPILMLLDEPFANLDHSMRRDMREEVMDMLRAANVPIIMVTHDPEEALMMADSMILMNAQGQVHQTGSPDAIHNHPVDLEAARFFGHINAIEGRVEGTSVQSKLGELSRQEYAPHLPEGTQVVVATRPEGIRMARDGEPCVEAVIEQVAHTGAGWLVSARLPEGGVIRFHHIYGHRPRKGDQVCVAYEPPHIFVFPQ